MEVKEMDVLLIVIALAVLFFLCFKAVPTPIAALVSSVFLMLCYRMDIYDTLKNVYMGGFVSFTQSWFLMFLFGSFLGSIMEVTGAADSLAKLIIRLVGEKRITLGIFLVSFIFTAAGISVYITLFILLPIAARLCRRANLPRIFIVAGYALGINVALAFPYVPVANNILATGYFDTELGAGGFLAVVCCLIFAVVGLVWLSWFEKRCRTKGIGYTATPAELEAEKNAAGTEDKKQPHWILGLIPLVLPIIAINVFDMKVEFALLLCAVVAFVLQFKYFPHKWTEVKALLNKCVGNAGNTIIFTAGIVGFGSVVQACPGYANITEMILGLNASPLLIALIATSLLGGVTGSSSSAIILSSTITTKMIGAASAQALHRSVVFGSLALESLPSCGFIHTCNNVAGVNLKDDYFPVWLVCTDLLPFLTGLLYIALASILGIA
ncbi:MAG: GntP family permease [Oscillospiraceae bacterium]